MWKPTLLILSVASMLTGCAFGTPPMPVMGPIYLGNADTDCPPLPSVNSGKLSDLVKNHKQVTDFYHDCKEQYRQVLQRADLSNPRSKTK